MLAREQPRLVMVLLDKDKATAIYPYDPSVIREHFFATSDASGGDVIQPTQETMSGHTFMSPELVSPKKN
jgi:hypothetical protein